MSVVRLFPEQQFADEQRVKIEGQVFWNDTVREILAP
jgi:hypothetical protein